MIFPTNMGNAIVEKILEHDWTPMSDPKEVETVLGDAFKEYFEENMTLVLQITVPPMILSPSGAPIPHPVFVPFIGLPLPLTGCMKCGGKFEIKSLRAADIGQGVAKLLENSYLSVSLDALIPGELPQPPKIDPPDLSPKITLPELETNVELPAVDFKIPTVHFDFTPPKIDLSGILDKLLMGLNIDLGANIDISTKVSIDKPDISLPIPSVAVSVDVPVSVTPPVPSLSLDVDTVPPVPIPKIELDIGNLEIKFIIPDINLPDATIKIDASPAQASIGPIVVKAEDVTFPPLKLALKASASLSIMLNGYIQSPLKIIFPPIGPFSLTVPPIGPINISFDQIGPVDITFGKFGFKLSQGLVAIPFMDLMIMPPEPIAFFKDFGGETVLTPPIVIDPIHIPQIFKGKTLTIDAIQIPPIEIDIKEWEIGKSYEKLIDININLPEIQLDPIPLSEYVNIEIPEKAIEIPIPNMPIEKSIKLPTLPGLTLSLKIDLAAVFPVKIPIPLGVMNTGQNLKTFCTNLLTLDRSGKLFSGLHPTATQLYWQLVCAGIWLSMVGVSPVSGDLMSGLCGDQYLIDGKPGAPSMPPAPTTLIFPDPTIISPGSASIIMAL